jgi:hypothetical protein
VLTRTASCTSAKRLAMSRVTNCLTNLLMLQL